MKLIIPFLFLTLFSFGQDNLDSWIGNYSGNLVLGFSGGANDTIPVKFEFQEIEKDSSWTYRMHYSSSKYGTMTKDYVIRAKKKGEFKHFLLDELNGIVMELTLMNNCFYGMYEVTENAYVSTIRKMGDDLFIELISSSLKNPMVTTAVSVAGSQQFEAQSFKPTLHQSVLLRRDD
jgi:hypothetical protein